MVNTSGVGSVLAAFSALGALSACGPGDLMRVDYEADSPSNDQVVASNSLLQGKATRASAKVAPIAAGTLLVSKDGHAVASDPDRDRVHVVDLRTQKVTSVQLDEGDEPGRVVEGASGIAYVAARRGGVVAEIDLAAGSARRIRVCAAPRGLAYDAEKSQLFVACRSGSLAEVDTSTREVTQRFQLEPDLRDVVLSGSELVVSRFKSAELLVVNRAGQVLRRAQPTPSATSASVTPSVAYRTLQAPGGGVLVGHMDSSNATLPSGAGAYYGAPCGGSVADMTLSVMDTGSSPGQPPSVVTRFNQALGGMAGPLDLAFSPDGSRLAILATGNAWGANGQTLPSLFLTNTATLSAPGQIVGCSNPAFASPITAKGEPVAVAFDASGAWVVQSREPAQLELESGDVISLSADSRFDIGLAMFHMNTGGGISCTSCHPEAGEDGHTWSFSAGLRRSQPLEGGAGKRAPFHWTGDLTDFDALFEEVMVKRMSLSLLASADQRAALLGWLDSVPRQNTADGLDAEAVERGRVLFTARELGCATCHSGADYSDNLPHDVGTGGAFITPSLLGVNLRAPLFHDGCALSLAGRFGACGGGDAHGVTSTLTAENRAELVAFMQSL